MITRHYYGVEPINESHLYSKLAQYSVLYNYFCCGLICIQPLFTYLVLIFVNTKITQFAVSLVVMVLVIYYIYLYKSVFIQVIQLFILFFFMQYLLWYKLNNLSTMNIKLSMCVCKFYFFILYTHFINNSYKMV